MQNRTHSNVLRKKVKNLKGFLKDGTIKKYMDINKKQVLKFYRFDLSYMMKIFLVLFAIFIIDYFYNIFYSNTDNV